MIAAVALPCLLAALAPPRWRGANHPLDGPDLDLRIAIHEGRVTLHVVMNLACVDELVAVPRADPYALPSDAHPAVEEALFAWYRANTHLALDGVAVTPSLGAFGVEPADPRLLPMFPIMGSKALIKVRLQLQVEGARPPQTVNLVWRTYPPSLAGDLPGPPRRLPVVALLTAGGVEQVVTLRHDEPEFTWHAPAAGTEVRLLPVPEPPPAPPTLPVPLASVALLTGFWVARPWRRRRRALRLVLGVCVLAAAAWAWPRWRLAIPLGAAIDLPAAATARAIFAPLHANIYRAFDHVEPSAVYDALARSVEGDLLDALYRDIYQSLVMLEEGGAVSRVQEVRPLQTDVERIGVLADALTPSFTVRTRWQVDGAVFHWGHHHWRTDEHVARYTVVATDVGWRIAAAEPIERRRITSGAGAAGGDRK